MTARNKDYYAGMDIIRVVACFLVIVIHIGATRFYDFNPAWKSIVIYDSLSRMSVPLFLMISGYLILDKTITSIKSFYVARFARILLPFCITWILYYFSDRVKYSSAIDYIYQLFDKKLDLHLWYIYVLVGIYAILPVFMLALSNVKLGRQFCKFFIVIWLIAYICLPFFERYYNFEFNFFKIFNFFYFGGYLGYVLTGLQLKEKSCSARQRLLSLCIYLLASLLIAIFTSCYSWKLGKPQTLFVDTLTPLVFIQACAFFHACKDLVFTNAVIRILSEHSYWIYLVHILILDYFLIRVPGLLDSTFSYPLLTIPLGAAYIFLFSLLVAIPLHKLEIYLLRLPGRCKNLVGKSF